MKKAFNFCLLLADKFTAMCMYIAIGVGLGGVMSLSKHLDKTESEHIFGVIANAIGAMIIFGILQTLIYYMKRQMTLEEYLEATTDTPVIQK